MLRHLQRLTDGLDQALKQDRLSRNALKLLQVPHLCLCISDCCHATSQDLCAPELQVARLLT